MARARVLLLAVLLTACSCSPTLPLSGVWRTDDGSTWTFFRRGSFLTDTRMTTRNSEVRSRAEGTYKIEGDKLTLHVTHMFAGTDGDLLREVKPDLMPDDWSYRIKRREETEMLLVDDLGDEHLLRRQGRR